jgi:ABC-type branched-subunit amino acid transport system substrate-binding protein
MPCRIIPSLYVALAVLLVPVVGDGQSRTWIYSAEAEKTFAAGLDAYGAERFDTALERLQRLLEYPINQRSSAGQLLQGKSLYRLGRFAEALDAARGLQRKFADSRYLPDARLLTGDTFYKLKRYYEAATQYGRLLATPAPLSIQVQAAERLAAIAQNGQVNERGIESLRLAVGAERLREALFFGRARWFQRLGWVAEADEAMQAYRDSVDGGIFAQLAANGGDIVGTVPVDLPNEIYSPEPEPETMLTEQVDLPRIGLLLPITGPYRQVGEELLEGVQLANEEAGGVFELIVADTGVDYGDLPIGENLGGDFSESPGSGLLRVVHGAKQLLAEGVVAMVGPVFSSSSVVAAVIAEGAGVPLLVPLSQQSGLDSLGRHVFQLRIIPETQAQLLGEYATLVLGLEHLVILSPLSDYGWSFEREFTKIAEINGAEIVHRDWYIPNLTKDFRRVFEEIRAAGFELMPSPEDTLSVGDQLESTTLDSAGLNEEPSFLTELLKGLEEEAESMAGEGEAEEAPPDSSEIFIDTIDGVVVVVESFADAQTIVPQVHFHRLETQVLGNDFWYDPEAIRQMRPSERKYLEGVTFVSAREEGAVVAKVFVDSFRKRFHRDPNYAASGYDAARLLVDGWAAGHHDPGTLTDWLAATTFYEGASGMISLSHGDSLNSQLILLKIDKGKIRPFSEADLPEMGIVEEDLPMFELDLPEDDLPIGENE